MARVLCEFIDCPVGLLSSPVLLLFSRWCAQVKPQDRFSRFMALTTCFRARIVLCEVRTMGNIIWGKYAPNPSPLPKKWAWIGNFKPNHRNIKMQYLRNYQSNLDQIWGPRLDQQFHFAGGLTLPRSNPIWLLAAILKNGYDVIALQRVAQFWQNYVGRCRMTRLCRKLCQNWNRK